LQNIVSNTIDTTSSLQAYEEAKLKVQTLNNFIDKVEERRNKPEVLIKDLVSSFLIPDVQRKKLQRQCKLISTLIIVKCNSKKRSSWRQQERQSKVQSPMQARNLRVKTYLPMTLGTPTIETAATFNKD
jgi:hypothetical protein